MFVVSNVVDRKACSRKSCNRMRAQQPRTIASTNGDDRRNTQSDTTICHTAMTLEKKQEESIFFSSWRRRRRRKTWSYSTFNRCQSPLQLFHHPTCLSSSCSTVFSFHLIFFVMFYIIVAMSTDSVFSYKDPLFISSQDLVEALLKKEKFDAMAKEETVQGKFQVIGAAADSQLGSVQPLDSKKREASIGFTEARQLSLHQRVGSHSGNSRATSGSRSSSTSSSSTSSTSSTTSSSSIGNNSTGSRNRSNIGYFSVSSASAPQQTKLLEATTTFVAPRSFIGFPSVIGVAAAAVDSGPPATPPFPPATATVEMGLSSEDAAVNGGRSGGSNDNNGHYRATVTRLSASASSRFGVSDFADDQLPLRALAKGTEEQSSDGGEGRGGVSRNDVWSTRCVSIVIAAHNEHTYVQRTLDSLIEASPPSVLHEIIVVDDASSPPLSSVCRLTPYQNQVVSFVVNQERQGLIRSKIAGAALVRDDNVLIFMDCHVRPDAGWLYPIIRQINTNYRRVVVPIVPKLDGSTWAVNRKAVGIKMMFDWDFSFHWFDDGNDWVPLMSGGLLAISARWWQESGKLDEGMLQWGSENIEQSIRVWLCGGEIVVARDSVVAHVFRPKFPYSIDSQTTLTNKVRAAEGWLDEYKHKFYNAYAPAKQVAGSIGDLSSRLELKQRLRCKPFQWYVNRFRDVFLDRGMVPRDTFLIRYAPSAKRLLPLLSADANISRTLLPAALQENKTAAEGAVQSEEGLTGHLCVTPAKAAYTKGVDARRLSAASTAKAASFRGSTASDGLSLSPCDPSDIQQRFAFRGERTAILHLGSNLCLDAASPAVQTPATSAVYQQKSWQMKIAGLSRNPPAPHQPILYHCQPNNPNQSFRYSDVSGRIMFSSYCLDARDAERGPVGQTLKLTVCEASAAVQEQLVGGHDISREHMAAASSSSDQRQGELSVDKTGEGAGGGEGEVGGGGLPRLHRLNITEIAPYQSFVLDAPSVFTHRR